MRSRAKRAVKTAVERAPALQQRRERQRTKTEEQREARLQRTCINRCERLAAETEQQRESRLQRMRANQSYERYFHGLGVLFYNHSHTQ